MKKAILIAMFVVLFNAVAFGQKGDGPKGDSPKEVADRIRGDAVRADNRGDQAGAREANRMADKAERSTPEGARQVEKDYNRGNPSSGGGGGRSPAGGRDRSRF